MAVLFLASLLDHPDGITGFPPTPPAPPSLQFVWSVDDSDATLPPPTRQMSSRSLSIRSVTEYRSRSISSLGSCRIRAEASEVDGHATATVAAATAVIDTCRRTNKIVELLKLRHFIPVRVLSTIDYQAQRPTFLQTQIRKDNISK